MSGESGRDAFLERVRESDELTITVRRRRSTEDFSAQVWFTVAGSKIVLVPMKGSRSGWFKDLEEDPHITLSAGGARASAEATVARGPKEVERILGGFRSKYASMWSESYYTNRDAYVEVPL